MEAFLRVNDGANLATSPSNSFIAEDNASICPLITPSPPTNDLINPLPETAPSFTIGEQLAHKLNHVQDELENNAESKTSDFDSSNDEKGAGDSASSSSSALAEPACTQLLNHRNVYHHIQKDEETAAQETNGKTQPLQLTFRNPPDNYCFMSWNWPLIRTCSLYAFLAGLVAMLALVITMISTLPRTCNPHTEWYQGSVLYEVFPASFYSEQGQVGNFKGLSQQHAYIKSLGVQGIRLNSIFATPNYPEDFDNVTSLMDIAPILGSAEDFRKMVQFLDQRNLSVILDLPLHPLVKQLPEHLKGASGKNESTIQYSSEHKVAEAIKHWRSFGVKGFYLKGLEHFTKDPNMPQNVRLWKKLAAPAILIVSQEFFDDIPLDRQNMVWNNIDLVDVRLKIDQGLSSVTKQLGDLQNSTLFTRRGMPWVHWSLGDVDSSRLANVLPFSNATLGATLLQLMLPGTPSIFYGDEIGLQAVNDVENERQDLRHVHHLTSMPWPHKKSKELPWLPEDRQVQHEQVQLIGKMVDLRTESPSIYMNSVFKEGDNKPTAEVKYSKDDFLVIQRWYPRRKAYVIACNLGNKKMTVDLSTLLYSGQVVVGPRIGSKPSSISFKDISLWPGESVVILLD